MLALPRMADVVVIGAGIAGAAAADALARTGLHVVVVEREDQPGRHATGRSAAMYLPTYGPPPVWALTAASLPLLAHPPTDCATGALLHPRPVLSVAAPGDEALLTELVTATQGSSAAGAANTLTPLTPDEAHAMAPVLRRDRIAAAVIDRGAADIDVSGLHQLHLRRLRHAGGAVVTSCPVVSLARDGDGWQVHTPQGRVATPVVVNAAGAWGDHVAQLAGLRPIGLTPMRRTAFLVPAPAGATTWPMINDAAENWYVKPESGRFLCSPGDETPSPPGDAKADELQIARAIDDINERTTLGVRSVTSAWAGLRTFAPDRVPVAGRDPAAPSFVWSVGQGGYGIQTAPAMGELVAALVTGRTPALDPTVVAALDPGRAHPGLVRF